MKKELLIFGASGALGTGVTDVLLNKDYDRFYLFDFKSNIVSKPNVKQIIVKDLSIQENVKALFSEIIPSKESVFYLFSTVGGFSGGKNIWELDSSDLDRMVDMNLKTNFLIAKYFSQLVKDSHSGSICFTSAFTGINPESGKSTYGMAKAALIYMVKTLAVEGKEINLSTNAIAPYIIDTPANRDWMNEDESENWIKPSEIGEFVHNIFLSYNINSGNIYQLRYRFNKD